jgi:DNA replication ATP-dependent helicase Dna2
MLPQSAIITGIESELKESHKPERFRLTAKERDGAVWKIWLNSEDLRGRLDESLEGAMAWWPGPPKGTGAILSVVPEEELVVLRFLSEALPPAGSEVRIYPIQYLEKLRDLWNNDGFASRCLDWWDSFQTANRRSGINLDPCRFPWLRKRQKAAFYLPSWSTSFLWGPPGTGKTTTLGTLLATYLQQVATGRVLLLSTTNSAVDQAIVAVDKALAELTAKQPQAGELRKQCLRIGTHFVPRYYEGREHLLPARDFSLIQRLMELHKNEPAKQLAQQYSRWKAQVEAVQAEIRKQAIDALKRARLAAMTTTGAVFRFDDFAQLPPYDLIVFDEASQVSIAHALALVGLGKRVLFAGDPQQLAPIVQSEHPDATEWLGKSPFSRRPENHPSVCLLNEQSRMAAPICEVISQTFYRGDLVVATEKRNDPQWLTERRPVKVSGYGARNAYLIRTDAEGKYVPSMGGFVRFETADLVCNLVSQLTSAVSPERILVLTPYRAQRALIKRKLFNAGFKRVVVSTVHRAQGSEKDTVIFDPVVASTPFLNNEDLGPRLINVAVSRAQARVFIIASEDNLKNKYLQQVAGVIEHYDAAKEAQPIAQFVNRPDFPACVVGKTVSIMRSAGALLIVKIKAIEKGGARLIAVNCRTGAETKLVVSVLRGMAGAGAKAEGTTAGT